MNVRSQITILMIFLVSLTSAVAKVSVPAVFGNDMVVQRGKEVPVWGWADSGEKVTVEFAGQKETVTADASGDWRVTLSPMKANANPQTLTIGEITISNVLVGDVWLCSGQSNMEYGYKGNGESNKNDNVRMFRVTGHVQSAFPLDNLAGKWASFGDGNARSFSGVGLFFGCKLQTELDVPIGLIDSSWGGSKIEPWISDEGYELMGKPITKGMAGMIEQQNQIIKNVRTWATQAESASKLNKITPFTVNTKISADAPNGMYNGMIAPLVPYGIKGTIWYQGESNRNNEFPLYFEYLKGLIGGWREAFNAAEMPFYLVQIAPYDYNRNSIKDAQTLCDNIWATQYRAAKEIKNCGVIPTHDTIEGNVKDIHPRDKKPVGERLAALALNKTYGKNVISSGPVFESAKGKPGKVIVSFTDIDQGLETDDGKAPTWFEISTDGTHYITAEAVIDGKNVVLTSTAGTEPKFVRMGWSQIAIPSLRDKNGWPAFPFEAMPVQ